MTIPIDVFMGGGGITLLGVVSYFLRKTHEKIDGTASAVTALGTSLEDQIDRLESKLEIETKQTKIEITQIFQDICHERQGACGRLQESKLLAVENKARAACIKADRIAEENEKRWAKQEIINDKIKRVLYSTNDGGKSWQLKDPKEE